MRHEPIPDASLAIAVATRRLISEYDAEIAARRAQLHADRALYRAKLTELEAQDNGSADGSVELVGRAEVARDGGEWCRASVLDATSSCRLYSPAETRHRPGSMTCGRHSVPSAGWYRSSSR